jgi:hypothetical protein
MVVVVVVEKSSLMNPTEKPFEQTPQYSFGRLSRLRRSRRRVMLLGTPAVELFEAVEVKVGMSASSRIFPQADL